MGFRSLLGEIRGFVLLFGADSGVGTHVHQRGNSALVFAIGELPQDASNGILIVAERKCSGRDTARAALPVGIVEVGSANTHGDVDNTQDRKSTRLNSSHGYISYAVFCLKKKKNSN